MKIEQPENELLGRTTKLDAASSLAENIMIKETNSISNSDFMRTNANLKNTLYSSDTPFPIDNHQAVSTLESYESPAITRYDGAFKVKNNNRIKVIAKLSNINQFSDVRVKLPEIK